LASLHNRRLIDVVMQQWPSDKLIERAVASPAMTSVAGWAQELARKLTIDTLDALGAASAAGQVLKECMVLNWGGAGILSVPTFVASASNGSFVQEGQPIPVRQLSSTAVQLTPFKLASIAVLTREMIESSNAEVLIGDALVRSAALAADAVLFGSGAATAAQPAGLRLGVVASTPSASTDPFGAFFEDMATLVNAVSAVSGNGPVILVANPGRVAGMRARYVGAEPNVTVIGSTAVGNDVLAIAPVGVVAALEPAPEVETSDAGAIVMDTAPTTPGTMTERSLFQTDAIALKARWPISWAPRDPRAVAYLTPAWK
jgi:hypothetical protein